MIRKIQKLLGLLLLVRALGVTAQAQTNVIDIPLASIQMLPVPGTQVQVQYVGPLPRSVSGIGLLPDGEVHCADVASVAHYTNLPWGNYLCVVRGQPGIRFSFPVYTNTLGRVNVFTLAGSSTNLPPVPPLYYTASQTDARILDLTRPPRFDSSIFTFDSN